MKNFRKGNYEEAHGDVKNAWIMFIGKIMPCINKNWNDDAIKISSLMSTVTSASDEAMGIMALEKN